MQIVIYGLLVFFILSFLFYLLGRKPITESATTSQNLTNNKYMTDVDTQLDDLINKIKNVENNYQNLSTVLKFGLVEKNEDPTADPEIYITGDPPNQFINMKLPQGLKGPFGCRGPEGNTGIPGSKGDLGNQGVTGLNVIPSLTLNRPVTSIE
jgi:hypothetical protein